MNRRAWVAFAALSLIWGVPYLFIKVAVDGGISRFFLAWARHRARRRPAFRAASPAGPSRCSDARALALDRGLRVGRDGDALSADRRSASEHVDSSVAAIVIATVPLLIALLALRFDHTERPTRARLVGMLIGLAGVARWSGSISAPVSASWSARPPMLVAAFGYAGGPDVDQAPSGRLRPAGDDGGQPRDRRRAADACRGLLTIPGRCRPRTPWPRSSSSGSSALRPHS